MTQASSMILLMLTAATLPARAETISVPLNQTNGWKFLSYRKIPPNKFRSARDGLEIDVTNSAAPAVFPLTNAPEVTELRASGMISGALKVQPDKQGQKGFDDYTVRIGLVESGKRTLSWHEKIIAADWVKKLFALAPRGTGISRIHFFNIGTDAHQIGKSRTHPLSDLIEETIVAVPDSQGNFAFTNRLNRSMKVLAVWISCDGDDTKSSFAVKLNRIELDGPYAAKQK
jgi:hypothetical protein